MSDACLPGWISETCADVSDAHRRAATDRQATLTKPAGSLGRMEEIAIDLAGIQQTETPRAGRVPILIFAGDHGVAARGVSAYPQDVTVAMLANFASGGAAISVLARELGSSLNVIDAGTLATGAIPGVIADKPCHGTRDFSTTPALDIAQAAFALDCGRRAFLRAGAEDPDMVILGDMGIGNTTASAAIAAALLGVAGAEIAGNGTGLDAGGRSRKARFIDEALTLHGLAGSSASPEIALCAVGGLEIAALTGAIIASAQAGKAVLVDGFIVSVAALLATRINVTCRPYLIFSHRSAEQGHRLVLESLAARPILDLDLRLGEGSGAAIALPIVRLACALHNGMATFAEAAVPERSS